MTDIAIRPGPGRHQAAPAGDLGERRLPHDRDPDPAEFRAARSKSLDVHSTERVLDVATGSGNAALAAARRGCTVVGIDYVPALLERARLRAAAEGVVAEFIEGDAEALPFEDASFDVVTSVFGAMFAPDQDRAAQRARPGQPARRPDRARRAHAGRLHRPAVQGQRPPRPAAGGPALADPVGHRGTPARAVRRSDRRDPRREAAHSSSATRRRRRMSTTGAATTARRSRRSRLSARPAGTALEADLLDLIARFNRADDGTMVVPSEYLEAVIVTN